MNDEKAAHTPLVSVIIPLYNQERYFDACLSSVVEQTYPHLEIIIVNDGSTDGSRAIAEEYAARDARVVIIDQPNAGVSAARNTALSYARGSFFLFVDGDDWLEPACVALMLDEQENRSRHKSDPFAVRCGYFRNDKAVFEERSFTSARNAFIELLGAYSPIAPNVWGLLIPASSIRDPHLRFREELSRSEDVLFLAELYQSGCGVSKMPVPLYHYRQHAGLSTRLYEHALAKAQLFIEQLAYAKNVAFDMNGAPNDALAHYGVRFALLSMAIESRVTGERVDVVNRAMNIDSIMKIMRQGASLRSLPLWARLFAQSMSRHHALSAQRTLQLLEPKLLP